MARGRKPKVHLTIDEQIAAVEAQIAECKKELSAYKAKKKALIADKEKADLEALYVALKDKGMSAAEAIARITQ